MTLRRKNPLRPNVQGAKTWCSIMSVNAATAFQHRRSATEVSKLFGLPSLSSGVRMLCVGDVHESPNFFHKRLICKFADASPHLITTASELQAAMTSTHTFWRSRIANPCMQIITTRVYVDIPIFWRSKVEFPMSVAHRDELGGNGTSTASQHARRHTPPIAMSQASPYCALLHTLLTNMNATHFGTHKEPFRWQTANTERSPKN